MSTRAVLREPLDAYVFHTKRNGYEFTTRDHRDHARQQVTVLCQDAFMRIEDLVHDFNLLSEDWPEVLTHVIPNIHKIVEDLVSEGYLEAYAFAH